MPNQGLPTAGRFLSPSVKNTFNTSINQLLSDMGRLIELQLKPKIQNCPNCLFNSNTGRSANRYDQGNPNSTTVPVDGRILNKIFANGQVCPVCDGQGKLYTPRTVEYTALISKDPKDDEIDAYIQAKTNTNVIKTTTLVLSFDDLRAAQYAVIDGFKFKPLREPVRIGLGNALSDLKYVKMFWERSS